MDDFLQFRHQGPLPISVTQAALNSRGADAAPFVNREIEAILHRTVVVQCPAAKVSRIITIDAELDTSIEENPDGQLIDRLDALQLEIAEWA